MAKSKDIVIKAGNESYPVIFSGYRRRMGKLLDGASKIALVSNPTVYALYGELFKKKFLTRQPDVIPLIIGDGERYKNQRTVNSLYDHLFDIGLQRNDVIIALGGGVVGDVAGFVAATFKRGVNLIQVPTTLLSMVDSSVGGKTGINHPIGKNLIGAFYQPKAVIVNPGWLSTLKTRQMVEGLAEIIKAGFLSSRKLLSTAVSTDLYFRPKDKDAVESLLRRAIVFKGRVVAGDVHDMGLRAILNFGHTFGHAVEKTEGFRRYHHGEAVMAGMAGAIYLSHAAGCLSKTDMNDCLRYLKPFTAHLRPLKKNTADYISPMDVDKKGRDGRRVFVLLEKIGRPVVNVVRSQSKIADSVDFMKEFVNSRGKM